MRRLFTILLLLLASVVTRGQNKNPYYILKYQGVVNSNVTGRIFFHSDGSLYLDNKQDDHKLKSLEVKAGSKYYGVSNGNVFWDVWEKAGSSEGSKTIQHFLLYDAEPKELRAVFASGGYTNQMPLWMNGYNDRVFLGAYYDSKITNKVELLFDVIKFDLKSASYKDGTRCKSDKILLKTSFPIEWDCEVLCSIDNGISYTSCKTVSPANGKQIGEKLNTSFSSEKTIFTDDIVITYDDIKGAFGENDALFSETGNFSFRLKYKAKGVTEWSYSSKIDVLGRFKKDIDIHEEELYVKDNNLHVVLGENVNLLIDSYISEVKDFSCSEGLNITDVNNKAEIIDNYFCVGSKYTMSGPYRLSFTKNDNRYSYCPVEYNVFVPELVKDNLNQQDIQFWYPEEKRGDVVSLKFAYPEVGAYTFNFPEIAESDKIDPEAKSDSIRVYDLKNMDIYQIVKYTSRNYSFGGDASLKVITTIITSDTKKFVPVINTFDLKAYPKITVGDVSVENPACYSNTNNIAKIIVADVKGGLSNGYKYVLSRGEKTLQFESNQFEVSVADLIKELGCSVGENTCNLWVEDEDSPEGDTGHDKRKSESKKITIIIPTEFKITEVDAPQSLCEGSKGEIKITNTTLGEASLDEYTYAWKKGEEDLDYNTSAVSGIEYGSYSVKVTTAKGCSCDEHFSIGKLALPSITNYDATKISCHDFTDGSIAGIEVQGCIPADGKYEFKWTKADDASYTANTASITDLSEGKYKLTVTDKNGCTASTDEIEVTRPSAISIALDDDLSRMMLSCNGGKNDEDRGLLRVNVSGGTAGLPGYKYQWSEKKGNDYSDLKNGTSLEIENLPAGIYRVVVNDDNNCSAISDDIEVAQPSAIKISKFPEEDISLKCFDDKTETAIEPLVSGGTIAADYSYSWTKDNKAYASTCDVNNLAAGNYTFAVKDDNGCEASESLTVTQPKEPLKVEIFAEGENCFGGKYNLSAEVSGGNNGYTYLWSDNSTDSKIENVQLPISYSVTVTDAKGCKAEDKAAIEQPQKLEIQSITPTDITCADGENLAAQNGKIEVSVAGGSGVRTYNWTKDGEVYPNAENYSTISSLTAGKYRLRVVDASNCSVESEVIELKNPELLSSTLSVAHVKCYDDNTGAIDPGIEGGTESYIFDWSNGDNKPELTDLKAGKYTLRVKDAKNCTLVLENIEITQPSEALGVTFEYTPAMCTRADGRIEATVTGGTQSYAYAWSNGAATKDISGLKNDYPYTLTITDANNCVLEAPPATLIGKGSPVITISKEGVVDVLCHGNSTGSITVSGVSGGEEPYSWKWYNALDQDKVISDQINLTDVSAGQYKLVVTDANGCTGEAYRSIEQPFYPLYVADDDRNILVKDVDCHGNKTGEIKVLNATGGTGEYTYKWSNGSVGQNPVNLPAGEYALTLTDANECTFQVKDIVVSQPQNPLSAEVVNASNVTCYGADNGRLVAKASGGTSGYTYAWSNGEAGESIEKLAPGEYKVIVSDIRGCKDSVSWTITQPREPLSVKVDKSENVLCTGGSNGKIITQAAGGTEPYIYSWSDGKTHTSEIGNLAAGDYKLLVTDNNGCKDSVSHTITQPARLEVSEIKESHKNVSCFGGSDGQIFAKAEGGTEPYSYKWDTGSTSAQIADVAAGNYSLKVSDAHGCESSIEKIEVAQPQKLVASIIPESLVDVRCYGEKTGSVEMEVEGGTKPYSYFWNKKRSDAACLADTSAGIYKFVVNDYHGCESDTVKVEISQQPKLESRIELVTPAHCSKSDGSIKASAEGGFGEYTFQWKKDGAKTAYTTPEIRDLPTGAYKLIVTDSYSCSDSVSVSVEPMDGPAVEDVAAAKPTCYHGSDGYIKVNKVSGGEGTSYTYTWKLDDKVIAAGKSSSIPGLAAGVYLLTVADAANCEAFKEITVGQPDSVMVDKFTVENVSCYGGSDGEISGVSARGGNGGYIYRWSSGSTEPGISGLRAGTYALTITDQKGCKGSFSQSISQPEKLEAYLEGASEPLCHGGSTGSYIEAKAQGGNMDKPYTYKWTCGGNVLASQASEKISGIPAGKYKLVVSDYKNCEATMDYTLEQPTHVEALISNIGNVLCHGGRDGYLEASAQGGTPGYTYLWGSGADGSRISNLETGVYKLLVTDSHGCQDSLFQAVEQPDRLQISATVRDALCNGYSDGQIQASAEGGTEPYSYLWSDGSTGHIIANLPIGTYKVVVADAHQCKDSITEAIRQPGMLHNSIEPKHIVCKDSELTIDDGDNGFDSYHWILPDQNIETGRILTITPSMPEGRYIMVSRMGECYTADTTEVSFSGSVLPVKFLMASETFLSDTLVLAEDSKVDGDFDWTFSFSASMFEDITADVASEHGNLRYLYVRDAGIDTITMYADNGVCHASISKSVSVIDSYRPEALDYSIVASGVFSKLQIGPNPNNGDFTLFANLSDAAMLDVALYDVQRSRRIQLDMSSYNAEADHFEIPFQGLGLASGAYTLLVSANGDTRQIKFVVE